MSFGQIKENQIFESSKGNWEVPIKNYKKVSRNTCKRNLGCESNCCIDNDSLLCSRFNINLLIINTDSAYLVKALHAGEVVLATEIDSLKFIVLIKFGNYFISYYPIQKLTVKKGEKINSGKEIGTLAKDLDDNFNLEISLYFKERELCAKDWINWKYKKL